MNAERCKPTVQSPSRLTLAVVAANEEICDEHFRLTLEVPAFAAAQPGQFVHLGRVDDGDSWEQHGRPLLRRAFSIAGLRAGPSTTQVDVIGRVVGLGTRWLGSLRPGDRISVLGPLGRPFDVVPDSTHAWLVAGGVGLGPILWLAKSLAESGKNAVAFIGAKTRDLLPVRISDYGELSGDGKEATLACDEFGRVGTPVVVATDDGSVGYGGMVGDALGAYAENWSGDKSAVVVYACGPEPMLASIARWCGERGVRCYLCLERQMACGTGTCQSCVVRVRDADDEAGWGYSLCCTDGPVFDARDVVWD